MKKKIVLLVSLVFLYLPCLAFAGNVEKEMGIFINQLVQVGKIKNFRGLQKMVGKELLLLVEPGVCFTPSKKFSEKELVGWQTVLLSNSFTGLKKQPLIILKDNKFDPYKPNACGSDVPAKYKQYYNKWFLYPGNYLVDRHEYCGEQSPFPSTDKTLIFFDAGGNDFYFGLKKTKTGWILQWVASNSECVA